jgi:hypothetical protein
MTDDVLLFVYATLAAVILIAIVAHYYMPTLVGATQAQAEYVALRDIAPTLILTQDSKGVYICINSTVPQRVQVQRHNIWMDAQKDCHINPGGQCVSGQGMVYHQNWPFCKWYLGTYRLGDSVTVVLRSDHAVVTKNYTVVAIPVRR